MSKSKSKRTASISDRFLVHTNEVNVRVRGINRMNIPGTFSVHLIKNDEIIASKAFYQSDEPEIDIAKGEEELVYVDFILPVALLEGGEFEVHVEPVNQELHGNRIPNRLLDDVIIEVSLPIGGTH